MRCGSPGGEADADIEHIALSLVAGGGTGGAAAGEFHRVVVSGPARLAAKEQRTIPFSFPLPWEMPITEVGGQALPGLSIGVRTELAIAKAVDKGDLDPVAIEPAPAQDAVLDTFGHLGFLFKSVELTLLADRDGLQVVLEADRRQGFDVNGRFAAGHDEARGIDWAELITGWLEEAVSSRPMYGGYGHDDYGDQYDHHGHPRRRGVGMGGVVAGAAPWRPAVTTGSSTCGT
ncbi:sporulation protein [Amycolatopsis magusensis]|uniref:sporulation protein n=1 Tax=Amycolatopsis magusensis TaxID=882444 RepID=UPI0024A9BB68|nr:sporulation protein [Amycolatopsis magusensis]MDI5979869.1 sporulation protein [Amycolatopsis magusensis]